ncbi:MAG: putative 3-oxoadipate enol-lactonase [Nitrospira sp.]
MIHEVNGIRLGYTDRGAGLPLVLLHAFPFNRTMWARQEALASRFRIITIDLRGHGESDAPAWRYSLGQYAADVQGLLDRLGVSRAVFVGLSMGGYLEFALYRHCPDLILGLVFADTRAEADRVEQVKWRFDLAQRTAAVGPSAVIDDMLPKLLSPKAYGRRPDLVEEVRAIIAAAPVHGIVGDLTAMAERPDSSELLSTIARPVLVIVGEDDVLTPPADAERIARGIPGARLVTIPDAGHLSNMEQPDLFNQALTEFADGLSAAKRSPPNQP